MLLHAFSRTELLLGTEGIEKLKNATVAIFGIGGVGTFTVEALARSGVGKLVLIDNDTISLTNINRQIHAAKSTVGKSKVAVMKKRVLDINPECTVTAHEMLYSKDTAEKLINESYDYVVDAIDMVTSKIDLIIKCKEKNIPIISSMGFGNKLDPLKLHIADISKTDVCGLARIMRKELKKRRIKKVKVIYSKEHIKKHPETHPGEELPEGKNQIPGSVSFVPSVAGLVIAGEVVKDIVGK